MCGGRCRRMTRIPWGRVRGCRRRGCHSRHRVYGLVQAPRPSLFAAVAVPETLRPMMTATPLAALTPGFYRSLPLEARTQSNDIGPTDGSSTPSNAFVVVAQLRSLKLRLKVAGGVTILCLPSRTRLNPPGTTIALSGGRSIRSIATGGHR